jgi:phage-related protein
MERERPKPLVWIASSEVVDDHDGDTYRAVYTVRFAGVVYVLHAFQKKARKGIATPKQEIDRVRARLKQAEEHYRKEYAKTKPRRRVRA